MASSCTMFLRGLQIATSLAALITLGTVFSNDRSNYGLKLMLGSEATNFALLMNYTALLYALYELIAVGGLKAVPPLSRTASMTMDALLVLLLLIAGIVLATFQYAKDCIYYEGFVHCGSLTAGTVFTFLTLAVSVAAIISASSTTGAVTDDNDGEPIPFVQESTPKATTSIV